MTQADKKLLKFFTNPQSLKFEEIHTLLLRHNFIHQRTSGSHHVYEHDDLPLFLSIPVHNNDCKWIYKEKAAETLKKVI